MKLKKMLSVALSAIMLGNIACVVATAEESKPTKTYNYVALGDSIAAGFGLSSDGSATALATDPALILTEDLIANPVQNAYAQIFGNYLAEMGAERGYTTTATNLSSTAYRATDVAKTILTDGYKGEIATWILETFVGEGGSNALSNYHNLYTQYLTKADLVSIQLGGNDIVMEILVPMLNSDNPVLQATCISLMLTLFGCDTTTALGGGLQILSNNSDKINYQTITEAATYMSNVQKNAEMYVENSANGVQQVVDAVQSVNSNADIALIGMFNPYGNSLVYEGQTYDMATIIQNIFTKAAEEICGKKLNPDEPEILPVSETEEKAEDCSEHVAELKQRVAKIKQQSKEKMAQLLTIVSEEISYPMQYLIAGKNVDPQMTLLNEKLKAMAEKENATFVDVYGISNELDLDPHPKAQGHKEIAEFMETALTPVVEKKMVVTPAESVALNKTAVNIGVGQKYTLTATVSPSDALQNVKWSTSDKKIATVDANGVVTGKKTGTVTITAKTDNGKKVTCKVNVKKAPESITLDKETLTLKVNSNYTFKKTISANSATSYKWTSSNPDVARVYSTGKIVAQKSGTTVITVTTYNGKTASCTVTVK
ncbi:MAG: Ig-like domain-containing protein [Clostridia bacterium]|nr:Ig-like domain-containing protein [Clostridia bacterium]